MATFKCSFTDLFFTKREVLEAHRQGLLFELSHRDTKDWQAVRYARGVRTVAYKLLVEQGAERILGAPIVDADAKEHDVHLRAGKAGCVERMQHRDVHFSFSPAASNAFPHAG